MSYPPPPSPPFGPLHVFSLWGPWTNPMHMHAGMGKYAYGEERYPLPPPSPPSLSYPSVHLRLISLRGAPPFLDGEPMHVHCRPSGRYASSADSDTSSPPSPHPNSDKRAILGRSFFPTGCEGGRRGREAVPSLLFTYTPPACAPSQPLSSSPAAQAAAMQWTGSESA